MGPASWRCSATRRSCASATTGRSTLSRSRAGWESRSPPTLPPRSLADGRSADGAMRRSSATSGLRERPAARRKAKRSWASGWLGPVGARGYASEAARALLRRAFACRRVERVIAIVDPHNQASVRVVEKLGLSFPEDGHLRRLRPSRPCLRSRPARRLKGRGARQAPLLTEARVLRHTLSGRPVGWRRGGGP